MGGGDLRHSARNHAHLTPMSDQEPSIFQRVLEALERAREAGEDALRRDKFAPHQDDPDCYPYGVVITLPRTHESRKVIRFLAKNLNWVSLGQRGMLNLHPRVPIESRLSRVGYLNAISQSLCRDGIDCIPEIHWR